MPSFSSISAVWLRVDQSDLEPMITPTSALIVAPLRLRPAARQNQRATRETGVARHVGANQQACWFKGAQLYRKAKIVAPSTCQPFSRPQESIRRQRYTLLLYTFERHAIARSMRACADGCS